MMDNIKGFVKAFTDLGIALLGLGIILGLLFGSDGAFGLDIVGNIQNLVSTLGGSGLVGLITVGIIVGLFRR